MAVYGLCIVFSSDAVAVVVAAAVVAVVAAAVVAVVAVVAASLLQDLCRKMESY